MTMRRGRWMKLEISRSTYLGRVLEWLGSILTVC